MQVVIIKSASDENPRGDVPPKREISPIGFALKNNGTLQQLSKSRHQLDSLGIQHEKNPQAHTAPAALPHKNRCRKNRASAFSRTGGVVRRPPICQFPNVFNKLPRLTWKFCDGAYKFYNGAWKFCHKTSKFYDGAYKFYDKTSKFWVLTAGGGMKLPS